MLAPVVIVGTGAILMLRMIGADLSTVVLTTGASALIVGLALAGCARCGPTGYRGRGLAGPPVDVAGLLRENGGRQLPTQTFCPTL